MEAPERHDAMRHRKIARLVWALLSSFVVESLVFGLAALPAVLFWEWHFDWRITPDWLRILILSMSFIPAYVLFAISLMVFSATAMRLTGWRTRDRLDEPIFAMGWPALDWMRYMVSIHLVKIFAGSVFRTTPVWTAYVRWNGGRLGRRVFINSLGVTDHNLLEFGDDVVLGGDVHLSGHTIEGGRLKTGRVRFGDRVTVGVGAVVGIDVAAGDGCQIGALSLVPKHSTLEAGTTYAGIPVRAIRSSGSSEKESNQGGVARSSP